MKTRISNLLLCIGLLAFGTSLTAQKLEISLRANALQEIGFDNIKDNFLNQPSIQINYNSKLLSFGIEGGILADKVSTLFDEFPEVLSPITKY